MKMQVRRYEDFNTGSIYHIPDHSIKYVDVSHGSAHIFVDGMEEPVVMMEGEYFEVISP